MLEKIGLRLLWFDSLGAKSASIHVESSKGGITIDPGAAAMQPSYPLPRSEKRRLRSEAVRVIEEACWASKLIIITHYHYDHHILPRDPNLRDPVRMYLGSKLLVIKDPNKYINESQWYRSRLFLERILALYDLRLEDYFIDPLETIFDDPLDKLVYIHERDYGNYTIRRKELLERGRKWFRRLVEKLWSRRKWIMDNITLPDNTRIVFGDGLILDHGDVRIKIFEPWFHGIEYDRTGWVTPILLEKSNHRIFYTSDLMGPIIEDYAYRIVDLDPDIIIVDGPPTYLFPYMFNRINLERAIDNMIYIIDNVNADLIIYYHHLLRDRRWRERISRVLDEARRLGVNLMTAAEYLGRKPLIDELVERIK
jgi:predicted metallo-beta-lactamase superfamily hydrolase